MKETEPQTVSRSEQYLESEYKFTPLNSKNVVFLIGS